ncbi:MAG: YqgE/AlgH family protein [Planctomycetes bacterium]|nr:YqgE/AlgH family protein [Planctomycetota bacterium]
MAAPKVGKGTLLIATPGLLDPNFRRTVVLVCEHGPQGSLGLVLNRPSPRPVREVLPEAVGPTGPAGLLHVGGPVGTQGLMVLHRLHRQVPGSQPILDGVHLGGEEAILRQVLGVPTDQEEGIRVFVGYAGWGARQLDGELAAGGWFTRAAEARFVFDTEPGAIWSEVLWSMGGRFRLLASMPPDPGLN